MKKNIVVHSLIFLAAILLVGIIFLYLIPIDGLSEGMEIKEWAFDPELTIDIVDRIDEDGTYTIYYCIGEEFVVRLDRNVEEDTGWISMTRGGVGDCRVYYECDWIEWESSQMVIDELVTDALNMVRERKE